MPTLIEIVPYDPGWPQNYLKIEYKLREILGPKIVAIDHAGSTSIPGMPAKPLIDFDVALCSLSDIPATSEALTAQGYQPRGNRYDDDVWAFVLRNAEPSQHVYLCPPENETPKRRLIFRDYLRTHPDVAKAYSSLKERLARQFP